MLYTEAQKAEHTEEILGLLYQIALRDSRIPIVLPSDTFTEEAALAVRAFQQEYGLPVTGEIDGDTWDKIVTVYHDLTDRAVPLILFPSGGFLLQRGDSGELVQLVQILMNDAGRFFANLPVLEVTGEYDTQTEDAVKQLQQIAGLPESGILDRKTWDALATLVNQLPLEI